MRDLVAPPLRLTILSSRAQDAMERAHGLEATLDGTASGIGWDLGARESPSPGVELLGERLEMRVFSSRPSADARIWLDATLHSVLVVLVDEALLDSQETMTWLCAGAAHIQAGQVRHSLLAVPFDEKAQERWTRASAEIGDTQTLQWTQLAPEPAGRLDQLALHVLNRMIRTVSASLFVGGADRQRIFISHAKQDGLQLAQSLRHYFGEQAWLASFYDARDIQPGENWQDALRAGVAQSLLLVIRTDAYDQRFWCRQEVRWADLFGVPRVVVDARSGLVHPGSDLALEAAPTVRVPDGNLARVLFAALQTILRSLVFQRRVDALRELPPLASCAVEVLPVVPSIAALHHTLGQDRRCETGPRWLIYPDPPMNSGAHAAADVLAHAAGANLCTPSQLQSGTKAEAHDFPNVRNSVSRGGSFDRQAYGPSRAGIKHKLRIGVSVGGSSDRHAHGFTRAATNRFTVRLARTLLAEGVTLAFGHDWRPEGVMEAITGIADDLDSHRPVSSEPTILNLLPWPSERSTADDEQLSRLGGLVAVRPVPLPDDAEALRAEAERNGRPPDQAYLQARGLTAMRHALVAATGARVAVGGKLAGYTGRIPGIVEEVLLSLAGGLPVYVAGLLGGAARRLGLVLLHHADPAPLWGGVKLTARYREVAAASSNDGLGDADLDVEAWNRLLTAEGTRDLLLANGLDEAENRLLLESALEEEVIELVRVGLARLRTARRVTAKEGLA